eukprot:CCRYP_019992-RC/>CCRYP_019992-RC protein AED:0.46 eAED:1.00 QI:0/0/0/1/0/0/2/0/291
MIVRGNTRIERSPSLHSIHQHRIFPPTRRIQSSMTQFRHGNIPPLGKFRKHLTRRHKHQFLPHRHQEFHHQNKPPFHLLRPTMDLLFIVPRLNRRYTQGCPLHSFGVTEEGYAGYEEFTQAGMEAYRLHLVNFISGRREGGYQEYGFALLECVVRHSIDARCEWDDDVHVGVGVNVGSEMCVGEGEIEVEGGGFFVVGKELSGWDDGRRRFVVVVVVIVGRSLGGCLWGIAGIGCRFGVTALNSGQQSVVGGGGLAIVIALLFCLDLGEEIFRRRWKGHGCSWCFTFFGLG